MSVPFTVGLHVDGDGSHPAAWRDARHEPSELLTGQHAAAVAALAESAGFSYITYAGAHLPPAPQPDVLGRLDPVQQAAFAGPRTSGIGLIPQIPVTYLEPFHVATQLASLDYVSGGRGGWLVSGENSQRAAAAYGREPLADDAAVRAEAADVVAAARLLWDSWEDDAVIRDLQTGRYLDRDKLHSVDFEGHTFSVKGPAITPRPPQGQLPVLIPLDLWDGAADVDAVLIPAGQDARRVAGDVGEGSPRVRRIIDLEIALDSRGETGADRLARLDAATPWAAGSAERFSGTPDQLVELIRGIAEYADGVRLVPASIDIDGDELRFAVIPALVDASVFVPPVRHAQLRHTFGLGEAANVFATQGGH